MVPLKILLSVIFVKKNLSFIKFSKLVYSHQLCGYGCTLLLITVRNILPVLTLFSFKNI